MERRSSSVDAASMRFLRSLSELQRQVEELRATRRDEAEEYRNDQTSASSSSSTSTSTSTSSLIDPQQLQRRTVAIQSAASAFHREVKELERISRECDDGLANSSRILDEAIEQEAELRKQIRLVQRQLKLKEIEAQKLRGSDASNSSGSTPSHIKSTPMTTSTAEDDVVGEGIRAARRKRITEALVDLQKQKRRKEKAQFALQSTLLQNRLAQRSLGSTVTVAMVSSSSPSLRLLDRWYRQLEPICIERATNSKSASIDAITGYHLLDDIECYDLLLEASPTVDTVTTTTNNNSSSNIESASLGFSTKRLGYCVRVKLMFFDKKMKNNGNDYDNNEAASSSSAIDELRLWSSLSLEVNERELRDYLVRDQAIIFIRDLIWMKIKALVE